MATLSVTNVEQFNKLDPSGPKIVKRKGSVASRRSSISLGGSSIAAATGPERWRRSSRGFSVSLMGDTYQNRAGTANISKPACRYENTYKMKPDVGCTFPSGKVEAIIKGVLETNLVDMQYNPKKCAIFAHRISEELKQRVKDIQIPRYKIVAHVYIGSNMGQGIQIASRAVWDTSTDSYASYSYSNKSLFAVGTVHAVYFE